jgi:cytochrome c biogenesis protein CcdA
MIPDFGLILGALAAGVVSSISPCVVAAVPIAVGFVGGGATSLRQAARLTFGFLAGMPVAFVGLGLAAALLGRFLGALGPGRTITVGLPIAGVGALLFFEAGGTNLAPVQGWMQARLCYSGLWGAAVLGALTGTLITPCATPVLAAALTPAGSGGALEGSALTGAAMLLA